jgi:4-diphosphocytidyl-2-C-methyl-D-erythritol kinase
MKLSAPSFTRITLALDIVGKITSGAFAGYHELSIIKHRINLFDTITVEDSSATGIICTHPQVPCNASNICWKALEALNAVCGTHNNAIITIDKNIPVMGGLAGGSANAATTLMLLNTMFKHNLTTAELMTIGRTIGMDVPYYFSGNTAFDTEATGILTSIPTSLKFDMLLVIPDFGVSTRDAYAHIDYSIINRHAPNTSAMREALLHNNRNAVISLMHNDFELSVFQHYPELVEIKQKMIDTGCEQVLLTGSGSTLIGIIHPTADTQAIRRKLPYTTLIVSSQVA